MKTRALATSARVASLSFAPVSTIVSAARADRGDALAGLIIGGIARAAAPDVRAWIGACKDLERGRKIPFPFPAGAAKHAPPESVRLDESADVAELVDAQR